MLPDGAAEAAVIPPRIRHNPLRSVVDRVFSFPVFLALALIVLAVLTVKGRFNDPDLWWHLRNGHTICTTGSIPRTEIYSHTTAGHVWTSHEWLSDVLIYSVYRWGGYPGLMLLLCALTSSFCVLLYILGWLAGGNCKIALAAGLVGWLFGTVGFAIRPQMVGNQFIILELILIQLALNRDRRWLWGLPPLFALWVNCHASHVFGFLILAVYWVTSLVDFRAGSLVGVAMDHGLRRRWVQVTLLSAAMLLVNPIGWHLPLYPFNLLLQQRNTLEYISEFLPVDLHSPRGLALLAVCGVIFLLVLLRRAEPRLTELGLLVLGLGFAVRHDRMLVLFGIVAVPVLCRMTAGMWDNYVPERDSRLGNVLAMALAIAVIVWSIPDAQNIQEQIADANPVHAVEFIRRTHLPGPMLNEFVWGGYLMWALPEQKVFIDGRADVYDWTGVFMEFGRWAMVQEDPRRLLDKYKVNFCLLSPTAPMSYVLPYLPGWREVYRDSLAVIFARS